MLCLCIEKCVVVSFTRARLPVSHSYRINGQLLQKQREIRDLGVLLDTKLTFKTHYEDIIKRANRTLGLLFTMTREFNDPVCVKTLYCALVRPILEYCSIVWCPSAEVWKERMERIQRKFTRFAIRRLQWSDRAK